MGKHDDFKNNKIDHVNYFLDPDSVLKEGIVGFFLSRRCFYIGYLLVIVGTPLFINQFTVEFGLAFCVAVITFIAMFTIIRHYRKVSFKIDYQLLSFVQTINEYLATIRSSNTSNSEKSIKFRMLSFEISQLIADLFSEKTFYLGTPDNSIGCIIKLYSGNGGQGSYRTVGISRKLSRERKENPTVIAVDKGLGNYIRRFNSTGVHIIRDLEEACNRGAWSKSPNDDLDDINTRMVSSINGYEGGEKVGIGMVFVTSAHKNQFCRRDAQTLMWISDLLGFFYSIALESINSSVDEDITQEIKLEKQTPFFTEYKNKPSQDIKRKKRNKVNLEFSYSEEKKTIPLLAKYKKSLEMITQKYFETLKQIESQQNKSSEK